MKTGKDLVCFRTNDKQPEAVLSHCVAKDLEINSPNRHLVK